VTAPTWEAVRIRCDNSKVGYDPQLSELLAAFAMLPNLLRSIQSTKQDPRVSPIHEARSFKERISRSTPIMEQDLKDPTIVFESLASPTSCMPTYYTFTVPKIAWRFCLYWAMIIIANSILMLQGEAESSLLEENQSAADNICKSIEGFRRLKPLGALFAPLILSSAYGVSNVDIRENLAEEYWDLLDPLHSQPRELSGATMQLLFDTLTGSIAPGNYC
jgi:hypothetical protein